MSDNNAYSRQQIFWNDKTLETVVASHFCPLRNEDISHNMNEYKLYTNSTPIKSHKVRVAVVFFLSLFFIILMFAKHQ